ncbi:MAG: hypothetical protein ACHP7K_10070, partial [Actinomycetales bacterium]
MSSIPSAAASGTADPATASAATGGPTDPALLHRLAEAHGVGTSLRGYDGREHDVAPGTLVKVLAALGIDAGSGESAAAALAECDDGPWLRMLPAAVVVRDGGT